MPTPNKAADVAELEDKFRSSNAVVLTEYRGLTVAQLKTLRRSLGENAQYAVVKNTLTKIAANNAGSPRSTTSSLVRRVPPSSPVTRWSRPRVFVTSPRRTPT